METALPDSITGATSVRCRWGGETRRHASRRGEKSNGKPTQRTRQDRQPPTVTKLRARVEPQPDRRGVGFRVRLGQMLSRDVRPAAAARPAEPMAAARLALSSIARDLKLVDFAASGTIQGTVSPCVEGRG